MREGWNTSRHNGSCRMVTHGSVLTSSHDPTPTRAESLCPLHRTLVPGLVVVAFALVLNSAPALAAKARHGRVVNFLANCRPSHFAPDDPIVFAGEPGRSHDHAFFGNKTTEASSTLGTLRRGGTTCDRKSDTAAYWVTTLFRDGHRMRPSGAIAYYTLRQFTHTHPYPAGLKMIAGDAHSKAPQSLKVTWWNCGPGGGVPASSEPPARCPGGHLARLGDKGQRLQRGNVARGSSLELHVRFPDCWNGRSLDSPNHHDHVAYSKGGVCPSSHPVSLPSLILIVIYPLRGGRGVELASGGVHSAHADFFNSWKQPALRRIVSRCSAGRPRCARR